MAPAAMIAYLQTPNAGLWHAADDGEVFVWSDDGSTAAFAHQLHAIVKPLVDGGGGLPSLTVLLMVVSALQSPQAEQVWITRLASIAPRGVRTPGIDRTARWLQALGATSAQWRKDPQSATAILRAGFENARGYLWELTGKDAASALETLRTDPADYPIANQTVSDTIELQRSASRCKRAWDTLAWFGRGELNAESIDLYRKTGLKNLPEPAESRIELPPSRPFSQLLHESTDDDELGQVLRWGRSIAAMVNLPRRIVAPEPLPIGGVSDITVRGTPERLLMTELASEPLMLMARIAMGQALYMNRETPPGPTPRRRELLIESGIRGWGVTRVRIAAMTMAIGASEERRGTESIAVKSICGDVLEPQSMHTREGLTKWLSRLDTSPHPAGAIAKWRQLQQTDAPELGNDWAEPILVVSQATYEDLAVRLVLMDVSRPLLIVTIDREGAATLIRRTADGDSVLQRLTMPALTPSNLRSRPGSRNLLLFLDQDPIPLASPYMGSAAWIAAVPSYSERLKAWGVTRDRRLLSWASNQRGCEQIIPWLPSSNVLAFESTMLSTNRQHRMVVGEPRKSHWLVVVDDESHAIEIHNLGDDVTSADYAIVEDSVLRFDDGFCDVFRCTDGQLQVRLPSPGTHLGHGFVMRGLGELYRYDPGSTKRWQPIKQLRGVFKGGAWVAIGPSQSPMLIANNLSWLYPLDGLTKIPIPTDGELRSSERPTVIRGSLDGKRWIVRYRVPTDGRIKSGIALSSSFLVDTSLRTISLVPSNQDARTEFRALGDPHDRLISIVQLRTRWLGVSLTRDGLILYAKQLRAMRMRVAHESTRLTLEPVVDKPVAKMNGFGEPTACDLETPWGPQPSGWTLRKAELAGGTVWLDSRGYVHLQRRDDDRQCTLILMDDSISGWFSQTGFFGSPYFAPEFANVDTPVDVPDALMRWLADWAEKYGVMS